MKRAMSMESAGGDGSDGHPIADGDDGYSDPSSPSPPEDVSDNDDGPDKDDSADGDGDPDGPPPTPNVSLKADSGTGAPPRNASLFEEVEDCLAQSLLIFLYADLRLLSATGRINTKFETLSIDSDEILKNSASHLAADPTFLDSVDDERRVSDGISPAQIMAVLLIELRKEINSQKEQAKRRRSTGSNDDDTAIDRRKDGESLLYFVTDPKKRNRFEDNMHDLIKAYVDMLADDLNADIPRVRRTPSMRRHVKSRANGSPTDSEGLALRDAAGDSIPVPRMTFPGRRNPRMAFAAYAEHANEQRRILMMDSAAQTQHHFEVVGDAVFGMGASNASFKASVNSSTLSPTEVMDLMQRAVESRRYDRLGFMATFFKDGSVSQLTVKSKAKIVWLNDWFPIKDLIYALSVDEEKRRVLVVFRGAITRADWDHIFDFELGKVPNPIEEDFENKPSHIKFYRGFQRYMFRKRKDTGTTKYQEIANLVQHYGEKRIGDDYTVAVTGHSLGGALSTLFAFFASTEDRFTKNGPIQMFTFGSPYVGGYAFEDSFKHQEATGKLQYARFFNTRDVVAHLPTNLIPSKRGSKFRHVGVGIRLRRKSVVFSCCTKTSANMYYVHNESFSVSYFRALVNNCFLNVTWPWNIRNKHSLNEHQKRVLVSKEKCGDDTDHMLNKSLDEIYQTLVKKSSAKRSK